VTEAPGRRDRSWRLPFLDDPDWQMWAGERAALEGVLSALRPRLSIEIGTAQGGSLRRIAAHSGAVHAFDVDPAVAEVVRAVPNAIAHVGDSAATLPPVLAELAAAGHNVDFALVDGDHSAAGVQRDVRALLASPACSRTVVILHDSANEAVRDGLEALGLPDHPKVRVWMPDFVPGYLVGARHERAGEIWEGLALAVLDVDAPPGPAVQDEVHENVSAVYRAFRDAKARAAGSPARP
jgi:hypothetical protein